jgi:hypothetical protein
LCTVGGAAIAAVRNSVRVARRVLKFMVGGWVGGKLDWIGLKDVVWNGRCRLELWMWMDARVGMYR